MELFPKPPPLIFDENEIPQAAISAGVAEMKLDQSLEILITDADAALYRAKHKGRNCVSL
jgi:PleD family two-component response regulator